MNLVLRKARKLKRQMRPNYLAVLELAARRRPCWVSPARIRSVSRTVFPPTIRRTGVGGDWDRAQELYENLEWHQACSAVLEHGQDWMETRYYQNEMAAISRRQSSRNFATETEFVAWLREFEGRYRRAREAGELDEHERKPKPVITVNVGRDGDLMLNSGMDELSIALLLRFHQIPVAVRARHLEWVEFRGDLCRDPRGAYAPLLHPDLEWMPSRRTGNDRFELMRRALVVGGGTLLDIGSYWGYFCQRFEEIGFDCTAVEEDPVRFRFLEKLKRANSNRFVSVNESIFDYIGDQPKEFSVVLALAVFHWFIRTKENHDRLIKLLSNIRTQEMFFIPHNPFEHNMTGAYWNPAENEFAEFIMKHAGLKSLTRLEQLGSKDSNRWLYHMTA